MSRKGFSLLELLGVIGIISILAAILFPVFTKLHARSNQETDVTNEKRIGLAIIQYVQDNSECYPMVGQYNNGSQGEPRYGGTFNLWDQSVQPYIKSFTVLMSPDDPAVNTHPYVGGIDISYAINGVTISDAPGHAHLRGVCGFDDSQFMGGKCSPSNPTGCGTDISAQRDADIPKPNQTILLTNCFARDSGSGFNSSTATLSCGFLGGDSANPAPDNVGQSFSGEAYPSGRETAAVGNTRAYEGNNSAPYDGGTTADYLFVDGHVASMTPLSTNPDPILKASQNFWVCDRPNYDLASPIISGFSPTWGMTGDIVAILGYNFTGAATVTINGKRATFQIVNDTEIKATVPFDASSTGEITVSSVKATASQGTFTYYHFPKITGVDPESGKAGDSIVITGQYLAGVKTVTFNKVPVAFHIDSKTQLMAIVPANATNGRIRVTGPGGTGTSTEVFTVVP